jgi:hypothetical protein
MRSRVWSIGVLAGAAGLGLSVPGFLSPIGESILLGSSIGLILAWLMLNLTLAATKKDEKPSSPEVRLRELVTVRQTASKVEHAKILDKFDGLLSRVEEMDDPEINEKVTKNFEGFLDRLTSHYPEWDAEGRLRTYVLMQKIADSLSLRNADAYLEMAYSTLRARGSEATELSHIRLNGKVERMYREPESERAHYLAGSLLLMNREDPEYAKGMVADAIHLWSDERFDSLLPDFKAVRLMSETAKREVEDMIEKEMAKARRAGNAVAIVRSREILEAIIQSRRESKAFSSR